MSGSLKKLPEFIINPNTNRRILVGGKSWLKLVKNGVLERGDYLPPNCAYKLKEAERKMNEDKQKERLHEEKQRIINTGEHPAGVLPVISGKSLVYQKPKLTAKETSKLTSEAAMDVISQIQSGELQIPDMGRKEARDYLQKIIFEKMLMKPKDNIYDYDSGSEHEGFVSTLGVGVDTT